MPAPPPESDPAIARTRGMRLIEPQASGLGGEGVCAGGRPADEPLELEPRQRGPELRGAEPELLAEQVEARPLGHELERTPFPWREFGPARSRHSTGAD